MISKLAFAICLVCHLCVDFELIEGVFLVVQGVDEGDGAVVLVNSEGAPVSIIGVLSQTTARR